MRLWAVVALVGCSGLNKVVKPPPAPLSLTTIFAYPCEVSGQDLGQSRRFQLSQRALDRAVQVGGERLAFVGPTEFKVLKPNIENNWIATDALPLLIHSGSQAEQGALLKIFIERRFNASTTETESKKAVATTLNHITTWLVRGELLHPSSGTVLVEVSGQVTVDPLARQSPQAEWDPAPDLTVLVEKIVEATTMHALEHAADRSAPSNRGARFVATPAASQWLPSTTPEPPLDVVEQELQAQNAAHVLAPTATEQDWASLVKAPAGTYVLVGDGKLQPGDVITTIESLPALPHTLARMRFKGSSRLEVKRSSGAQETVQWP